MLNLHKTPVSLLQEHLIQKQQCPKYDLVYDGTGSHNPKFTFRVQADGLSQEGSGKNKQEAKHKAAENMLKAMGLIKDEEKEVEEESEDLSKTNYVGDLKEFCFLQNYPDPIYDLEEEAGPAHSKVFKMICSVSHLRQVGVDRTKKGAKHKAAAKMLQQLKECVSETPIAKEIIIIPEITLSKEEISERYKNAKLASSQNTQNYLAFYKDHHNAFLKLNEDSPTLDKLKKNLGMPISSRDAVKFLEDIARELKVKLSTSNNLEIKENCKQLVVVTMALTPVIAEIGSSYENAASKLLNTLLILSS